MQDSPASERKLVLWCLLLLVLALVAFYLPWLSGQASFFFEDTCDAFEPICTFVGRSLAHGHLPLWEPYNYCGMPEIVVPGLFYPPNILFAFLPYSQAVAIIMILSEVVCGVGGYLLARSLGWRMLPALLTATVLAGSGYMFSFVNNYTLVAAASWLPACLLCARHATSVSGRHALYWSLALALFLALMFTAGRPEIGAGAFLLVCGYSIYSLQTRFGRSPEFLRQGEFVFKGILVGLLIGMVQILPIAEWVPISRRAAGLASSEVLLFSANWYHLVCLYAAQPLGDLQINYSGLRALVEPKNFPPYLGSAFVGSAAFVPLVLAFRRWRSPLLWLTTGVLILSLLASMAGNVPFVRFLVEHIQALAALRFPSKLLFFPVFCIAMLAARGLNSYLAEDENPLPAMVVPLVGALTGVVVLVWGHPCLPFEATGAMPLPTVLKAQHLIAVSMLTWSLVSLCCVTALWLGAKYQKRQTAAAIVVVVSAISLMINAVTNCRAAAPGDFFARPSFVQEQLNKYTTSTATGNDGRVMMLALQRLTIPPRFTPTDPLARTVAYYDYQRQLLKPFGNMDFRVAEPWGWEGAVVGEFSNLLSNAYLQSSQSVHAANEPPSELSDVPIFHVLQATATRFVVAQMYRAGLVARSIEGQTRYVPAFVPIGNLDPKVFAKRYENADLNVRIYELVQPLPRAYFLSDWKVLDRNELIDKIFADNQQSFEPNKATLVEEAPQGVTDTAAQAAPIPLPIDERQPEDIVINVNAPSPGLVVLCDQFYPGWNVQVDGRPAQLLRANGFFKATPVQAGVHVVRFIYQPMSLAIGGFLAALGLCWALMLLWTAKKSSNSSQQ